MSYKTNIVLTGVGGQGVITATHILGKAAVANDVTAYASEVHGMAQRGGTVICTVRMGEVSGPLLRSGTADAVISTEPIEALRYIKYAHQQTNVITDINPVIPFTVSMGMGEYPQVDEVLDELQSKCMLHAFDALKRAQAAGLAIAKNTVLLGALSAADILPFESENLLQTILESVPEKYQEINTKAFHSGVEAIQQK